MAVGFQGERRFLSNFYEKEFYMPQLKTTVKSGEHAYQALKTHLQVEREWVLEAATPGEAKRRGRKVSLMDDWNEGKRFMAMLQVIKAKFRDEELEALLYATEGPLVEYNHWHDTYFGVCTCEEHRKSGRNVLGEMLMMRRSLRDS